MADYIIQKAVERDKVKKKLQRSDEEYAATFAAQAKLDGCCAVMVLTGGDAYVLSRTCEAVPSMAGVAAEFQHKYKREVVEFGGIVLVGEAWNPNLPQNVLSGLFRQHALTDELLMMVFDVLTYAEFSEGYSPVPWIERINRLTSDGAGEDTIAWHEPGTYGSVAGHLNREMSNGGRDGIILRDPQGTWTRGRGTTGEIVKVKRSLSFDLRVVGVEYGKGKHEGRMGALSVSFGDKVLNVGTGFSDAQREAWIGDRHKALNDCEIVGRIVEVEAMDYSADGLLREPRFKGIRHDKLEPDTIAA